MITGKRGKRLHLLEESRPTESVQSQAQRVDPLPVHTNGREIGVVERAFGPTSPRRERRPRFDEGRQLVLKPRQDLALLGALVGIWTLRAIQRFEGRPQVGEAGEDFALVVRVLGVGVPGVVATGGGEPLPNPFFLDDRGIGLVEGSVAWRIERGVRDLVKQQSRELGVGAAEEGIQHRVAQPTEGRVRGGTGDRDLEPVLAHAVREALGTGAAKVAPVGDAAGDRKAPGPRMNAQLGRRDDIPDDDVSLQVEILAVALPHLQPELLLGKGPNVEHEA